MVYITKKGGFINMANRLDTRFVEPQLPSPEDKAGNFLLSDGVNLVYKTREELGLLDNTYVPTDFKALYIQPSSISTNDFAASLNHLYILNGNISVTLPVEPTFNDSIKFVILNNSRILFIGDGINNINNVDLNKTVNNVEPYINNIVFRFCGAGFGWIIE